MSLAATMDTMITVMVRLMPWPTAGTPHVVTDRYRRARTCGEDVAILNLMHAFRPLRSTAYCVQESGLRDHWPGLPSGLDRGAAMLWTRCRQGLRLFSALGLHNRTPTDSCTTARLAC